MATNNNSTGAATNAAPFLKIKQEYKATQIGFNNCGIPLGFRDDLDVLARIALDSNDATLLNLFETAPTYEQLQQLQGEKFLQQNP